MKKKKRKKIQDAFLFLGSSVPSVLFVCLPCLCTLYTYRECSRVGGSSSKRFRALARKQYESSRSICSSCVCVCFLFCLIQYILPLSVSRNTRTVLVVLFLLSSLTPLVLVLVEHPNGRYNFGQSCSFFLFTDKYIHQRGCSYGYRSAGHRETICLCSCGCGCVGGVQIDNKRMAFFFFFCVVLIL